MHKAQKQVREFHQKVTKHPISPAEPKFRNPELRARLILEEAVETIVGFVGSRKAGDMLEELFENYDWQADTKPNLVDTIDGICDTVVVCMGSAEDIGIDLEPFYDEVMRSNLSKEGGEVREDGKRLKPPTYSPPDIAGILDHIRRNL